MVSKIKIISRIPPFLRNKYVLTLLFFVVWITIFDKNSLLDWINAKIKLKEITAEQQKYQQLLNATATTIEDLKNNNDSLEKFARERYGFHKDDEDVFIVED